MFDLATAEMSFACPPGLDGIPACSEPEMRSFPLSLCEGGMVNSDDLPAYSDLILPAVSKLGGSIPVPYASE